MEFDEFFISYCDLFHCNDIASSHMYIIGLFRPIVIGKYS